jgi:hypothetical protein
LSAEPDFDAALVFDHHSFGETASETASKRLLFRGFSAPLRDRSKQRNIGLFPDEV